MASERDELYRLLIQFLPGQFDELVYKLKPNAYHLREQGIALNQRAIDLISLMFQGGQPSVIALQEAILSIISPFSPFNGNTLENWVGYPQGCWQVVNSKIIGVGNDPLTFSDLDTPIDLRYASLLTWEGLSFRDSDITVSVWVPLVRRGGAGGLVLRNLKDKSALIGLLRQVQTINSLALELWHRESTCLRLLQSVPCLPHILTEGSCWFKFRVIRNSASISVTSALHPEGASASCNTSVPWDQSPGHVGFVKFGGAAVTFASLKLTVYTRENGLL